jgi:hypothetical protein
MVFEAGLVTHAALTGDVQRVAGSTRRARRTWLQMPIQTPTSILTTQVPDGNGMYDGHYHVGGVAISPDGDYLCVTENDVIDARP